jgi:membrane protease subunit (stomatin/prohibitin family)
LFLAFFNRLWITHWVSFWITKASAAVDKYCADNGIVNKCEVHDGMSTMDWMTMEQTVNDVGITVPGSKSTQKFQTVTMGAMEAEKYTIVLKLLGETADNQPVAKPITVKHKPKCITCGKVNKATAKFCTECGTHLTIYA